MIKWYEDSEVAIFFSDVPDVYIRFPANFQSNALREDIKLKPFINNKKIEVVLRDYSQSFIYEFEIKKDYTWDGASIPRFFWRLIGSKTDNRFLIPSLVHDVLCENHNYVDYDRYFSSMVFERLIRVSGVNPVSRCLMFHSVDNFQKFKGWNND